jgi:hypothetical protein
LVIFGEKGIQGYKSDQIRQNSPHTYYENCPQFSKLSGVIQQLFYFYIYNFSKHFQDMYNWWGITPTLKWYTRVKTHVHAIVFDSRVASLTRPRIKWFMGKWSGIATQRFGEKLEWDCHSQNYECIR